MDEQYLYNCFATAGEVYTHICILNARVNCSFILAVEYIHSFLILSGWMKYVDYYLWVYGVRILLLKFVL